MSCIPRLTAEPWPTPVNIFQVRPPVGLQIVVVRIEVHSDTELGLTFGGGTAPYAAAFRNADIPGGYADTEDGQAYYRVVDRQSVETEQSRIDIMEIFGARVLQNLAVRIVPADVTASTGSAVAVLLDAMRANRQLHFL